MRTKKIFENDSSVDFYPTYKLIQTLWNLGVVKHYYAYGEGLSMVVYVSDEDDVR